MMPTAGTITYEDPDTRERVTTPVTGGRCKLQWKPDWAMRWVALGVDYEMAGKDLIDSVKLSGEICRALGGTPPEGFNYELFLDEKGQKISKSKGNGLTIDEWLRYASPESLSLFMYREPKAAKRLYFDVIPRHVDEYQQFLEGYERQDAKQRLGNPVWHIHARRAAQGRQCRSRLRCCSRWSPRRTRRMPRRLWGFIGRYRPGVTPATHPQLAAMVDYAIHYFRDFVLPEKKFREPSDAERAALIDLRDALSQLPAEATAEASRKWSTRSAGASRSSTTKKKAKDGKPGVSLDWFNMLYQVLLGQEKGPRFGSFVAGLWLPEHGRHDRRRAGALGHDPASASLRAGKKLKWSSPLYVLPRRHDPPKFLHLRVFGMAGGMILLGVLSTIRRRQRDDPVLESSSSAPMAGAPTGGGTMCAGRSSTSTWSERIAFCRHVRGQLVPNKMMVYLSLGLMPFAIEALPARLASEHRMARRSVRHRRAHTIIQVLAASLACSSTSSFGRESTARPPTPVTNGTPRHSMFGRQSRGSASMANGSRPRLQIDHHLVRHELDRIHGGKSDHRADHVLVDDRPAHSAAAGRRASHWRGLGRSRTGSSRWRRLEIVEQHAKQDHAAGHAERAGDEGA